MSRFFQGKSQSTFIRHSALDNGTYVSFKDASKDQQENPILVFIAMLGLVAFGVFCMRVVSVWGY